MIAREQRPAIETPNTWTDTLSNLPIALTPTQHAWLTDTDSLTLKLQTYYSSDLNFTVDFADWSIGTTIEHTLLGIRNTDRIWLREIVWSVAGKAWIRGRSIVPEHTLDGPLKTLGNRSLGTLLFGTTTCQRSPLTYAIHPTDNAITRRSLFYYHSRPLLITETFTPDFFHDTAY